MSKIKGGIILLVIFILSIYYSVYFEESFREAIRRLYVAFTNGKISFFIPKKSLHFASGQFVSSFGIFTTTICFLIYRQTNKQRIISITLGVFALISSVLMHSYFGSLFKLIECTVCNDGTRKLRYGEINYDLIFISSLILAMIPAATIEIRKLIKLQKRKV